ncbi:EAL domain-containing protein [Nitratifractor sp.]
MIDTAGVEPYVQPIVNAQNGEVEKYECLMRFVDTQENKVYSAQPFLQIAKEIHLYHELEYIMIEKCFKKFSNAPYHFSLNLGYEDISDEQFRRYICQQISGFPEPERITFEILEGDFIEDFGIITEFITKIRQYGCKIAIDDFGAGYSNMKNILELRPDYIKIDGSIIRSIHRSQDSLTILKSIIQLAHDLQIQTIAEHVHHQAVLNILQDLGVDYYQGFYFSKPFPIGEIDTDQSRSSTKKTL